MAEQFGAPNMEKAPQAEQEKMKYVVYEDVVAGSAHIKTIAEGEEPEERLGTFEIAGIYDSLAEAQAKEKQINES